MQENDITRLASDERFLNYCFRRNADDVLYWQQWMIDHPQEAPHAEALRKQLILMAETSRARLLQEHFAELQARIHPPTKQPVPLHRRIWYAAAAVAILITGAAVFLLYPHQANDPSVAQANIQPGSNKAVLTLSNGRQINLSDAANGNISTQHGIKITKTADGEVSYDASASTGDAGYNTVAAPAGGQWHITLPDRSEVWLNALSSITYPARFNGNSREVQLTGEAYFEVTPDKQRPFRVSSRAQTVEVLGTHFNILAYQDEAVMKTTLLEGAVKVVFQNKSIVLQPGQQSQAGSAGMIVKNDVDLEDVIAWKNGYFKFNEDLESIMHKLARWYDVEVEYQGDVDKGRIFAGKISRSKDITAALRIMELTGKIHFKIEGRRVIIMN